MNIDNIQFLTDSQGNKTAVIIPIGEWDKWADEFSEFSAYRKMKNSIESGLEDFSEIKKGNAPKISLNQFLEQI